MCKDTYVLRKLLLQMFITYLMYMYCFIFSLNLIYKGYVGLLLNLSN